MPSPDNRATMLKKQKQQKIQSCPSLIDGSMGAHTFLMTSNKTMAGGGPTGIDLHTG